MLPCKRIELTFSEKTISNQRVNIEKSKEILKELVHRFMPKPGDCEIGSLGVHIYRRDHPKQREITLYCPRIVKMIQGAKQATFGNETFCYGENDVMVMGVDMPGVCRMADASPENPCTAISIDLNKNLIAQLAIEMPQRYFDTGTVNKGMLVQALDAELLDAFLRLAELFHRPERLPIIGPMIIREIHYLMLIGPNGHKLRSFYTLGFQNNKVAQAISWLKNNLAANIQIEELAKMVNMAPSTFHRHFKNVTALSPIQFQKRLRLHEAQRLMLMNDFDASSASAAVGYENISQFNREYKRLFGDPPRRNIENITKRIMS